MRPARAVPQGDVDIQHTRGAKILEAVREPHTHCGKCATRLVDGKCPQTWCSDFGKEQA